MSSARDAHAKRLKFSASETPTSNIFIGKAPKSSLKKRPGEKRPMSLSSASASSKKKLATPAWLEAMLKPALSTPQLSPSTRDSGASAESNVFSSFMSAIAQTPKTSENINIFTDASTDKSGGNETTEELPVDTSEHVGGSNKRQPTEVQGNGNGAESDGESSQSESDHEMPEQDPEREPEDVDCIGDGVVDFDAPGTPFQTVPRTPIPGLDLNPDASPQVESDNVFSEDTEKPKHINDVEEGRCVGDGATKLSQHGKVGITTPTTARVRILWFCTKCSFAWCVLADVDEHGERSQ